MAGGITLDDVNMPFKGTNGCVDVIGIQDRDYPGYIWMHGDNLSQSYGSGFVIEHNFKAGYNYTISFDGQVYAR